MCHSSGAVDAGWQPARNTNMTFSCKLRGMRGHLVQRLEGGSELMLEFVFWCERHTLVKCCV